MSARTLSAGSPPPGPVPQGAVRVYSMRFCPYAQRVLLVLMTKGIRHEVVNINLKNKPEWFLEKNPLGLVPVLENSQGQLISDSVIICDYLDEAFPGKKLVPDDPYEKACQRMILELFSKVPSLRVSIIRLLHKKEDCSDVQEELKKELNKLDEVLVKKRTTFFGGDSATMVDYLLWPWFQHLELLEMHKWAAQTLKFQSWMAAMKQDPAAKALFMDLESYQNFLRLYIQGSLEACDYGL
ncbi:glutathione S-transferase omega-1 isoform X1 [Octodon degus]|uniref:Glutathione S-transferase omega n=1 Tax=Octodon degus TaxID=10160 RepID=A0A6P3ETV5_OCTDE|nr:glutathione S-transferase omega-1 isoform X1 [Octodon degus]